MLPKARRLSILLVDDEPDILDSLSTYIEAVWPEVRVLTAPDAAHAQQVLAKEVVDVVVSDLKMPGIDGLEFLGRVRVTHPQVARILITAFADDSVERRAHALGVENVLRKPFELDQLTRVVQAAMG